MWITLFIGFYLWGYNFYFKKEYLYPFKRLERIHVKILKVEPFYDKFKILAEAREIGRIEFTSVKNIFLPGNICELTLREKKSLKILNPFSLSYKERFFIKGVEGEWILEEKEKVYCIAYEGSLLENLRLQLMDFAENLSPLARGLFIALVLGIETQLPEEYLEKLKTQGLYHQLAISGFNLGILFGIIYKLARLILPYTPLLRLGLPIQIWASLLALPGAGILLILSGFQAPTLRAFFFLLCLFLSKLFFRLTPSLYILLLAGSLLVLFNPTLIGSASFQLSFVATLALILGDKFFKEKVFPYKGEKLSLYQKILYSLGYALFISTFISLFTFPFLIYMTGYFPLASPINNLIATPMWSLIFIPISIFCALLAFIFPTLAQGLLDLMAKIFEFYSDIPLFEWIYQLSLPVNLFLLWLASMGIFMAIMLRLPLKNWLKFGLILFGILFSYFSLQKLYKKVDFIFIPKLFSHRAILIKEKENYFLLLKEDFQNPLILKNQLLPLLRKFGVKEIKGVYLFSEVNDLKLFKEYFSLGRVYSASDFEIFGDLKIFKYSTELIPIESGIYLLEFKGITLILVDKDIKVPNRGLSAEIVYYSGKKRAKESNAPLEIFEKKRNSSLYLFPKEGKFLVVEEVDKEKSYLLRLFFPLIPYILEVGELKEVDYQEIEE
ncbi:MAG: ComEC/Rec2 family competence protein [Caldimicrobium sp.]